MLTVRRHLAAMRQMEPHGRHYPHDWKGAVWIKGTAHRLEVKNGRVGRGEQGAHHLPRLINALWWGEPGRGGQPIWSLKRAHGTLWAAGVDPASLNYKHCVRNPDDGRASWFGPWDG